MPDLGAWVIVAAIAWPGGHIDHYTPTTRFPEAGCIAEANAINHRWHEANIVGFATCRPAQVR